MEGAVDEGNALLRDILPDLQLADRFLDELLPQSDISAMDILANLLKGNWIMEPGLIWDYICDLIRQYLFGWRNLFVCVLGLFVISAVINTIMSAFKNEGAALAAKLFFVLCQMLVLINAFKEVKEIMLAAMERMIEFLKLMLPAYMLCVGSAGYALSAAIFYKLLLGFLCLMESMLLTALVSVIEGYVVIGVLETVWGEDRFKPLLDMIKNAVQGVLKLSIMIFSGSSILQIIITPVIDKNSRSFVQKTAGAIPGIGDIAESVSNVTIASAVAIKNSVGVIVLFIILLIIATPVIKMFVIMGTVKLGCVLGAVCADSQMAKGAQYITDAGFLLIRTLVTVSALFFVAIAAVINSTG